MVRSLAGMHAEVTAQICDLNKLTVAVIAQVRFLSSVEPHVCFEVVITREALFTHCTFERFLSSMSALVVLKHVFVSKGTVAYPAGEHFVPTC